MKQGVPQASLRAQWYDHAELRNGAKRKNTFSSRLLAVEAREAVRRQAIGKSRPQTAGLSTIRTPGTHAVSGGFFVMFLLMNRCPQFDKTRNRFFFSSHENFLILLAERESI